MTHRQSTLIPVLAAAGAALLALAAAVPPSPSPTFNRSDQLALQSALDSARAKLTSRSDDVRARGASVADLMGRLDADLSAVGQADATTPADTWETIEVASRLDLSLIDQFISGTYVQPSAVNGAGELLVPSSSDKSLQPLALYIPKSYASERNAPLVLMLPAQDQSESALLATPFLRALADRTGAVFAVPSARGDDAFDGAGGRDVYDAVSLLESSLHIDRRHVYLSGFSLGGFGMFIIAPQHPQEWTALLGIAATLTNEDKTTVASAMAGKQIFLVIGSDDPHIRPEYVQDAAAYLNGNGVEARFYEQPHGVHSLQSLQPSIEHAWRDMLSGVRNVAPSIELPSPVPTGSRRT